MAMVSHRYRLNRPGYAKEKNAASQGNIIREAGRYLVSIGYDRGLLFPFGVSEHFSRFLRVPSTVSNLTCLPSA